MKKHYWSRLDWHCIGNTTIQGFSAQDSIAVKYSKGLDLSEDCKVVASTVVKLPPNILQPGFCRFCDSLLIKLKFDSLNISKIIGNEGSSISTIFIFESCKVKIFKYASYLVLLNYQKFHHILQGGMWSIFVDCVFKIKAC